jgi:hypothetical protein
VAPAEEKALWDLVLLSDSSGWGVADLYAAYLEQELDVTVAVHDLSAGSLSASSVLAALRGERSVYPLSVDVPGLVRKAEVVVVYGNPVDRVDSSPLRLQVRDGASACACGLDGRIAIRRFLSPPTGEQERGDDLGGKQTAVASDRHLPLVTGTCHL